MTSVTNGVGWDTERHCRPAAQDVIKVVNALPSVFSCSIEGSLAPKLRYLTEAQAGDASSVRPSGRGGRPPDNLLSHCTAVLPKHTSIRCMKIGEMLRGLLCMKERG